MRDKMVRDLRSFSTNAPLCKIVVDVRTLHRTTPEALKAFARTMPQEQRSHTAIDTHLIRMNDTRSIDSRLVSLRRGIPGANKTRPIH